MPRKHSLLLLLLAPLMACGPSAEHSSAPESEIMDWRLPDGRGFSAWASEDNTGDEPVYLFVDLRSGGAAYRVAEAASWKPMRLETEADGDGDITMFVAREDLPRGRHRVEFRIRPVGGGSNDFCCVVAVVE